ncbi:MAG: hypothetical protein M3Q81_05640 [bacterium]|nr:hypothetical protein [bacterium]
MIEHQHLPIADIDLPPLPTSTELQPSTVLDSRTYVPLLSLEFKQKVLKLSGSPEEDGFSRASEQWAGLLDYGVVDFILTKLNSRVEESVLLNAVKSQQATGSSVDSSERLNLYQLLEANKDELQIFLSSHIDTLKERYLQLELEMKSEAA